MGIYNEDQVKFGNSSLQFDKSSADLKMQFDHNSQQRASSSQAYLSSTNASKSRNKSMGENRKNFLRDNTQNLSGQKLKHHDTQSLLSLSKSQFERSLSKKFRAPRLNYETNADSSELQYSIQKKPVSTAIGAKRIPIKVNASSAARKDLHSFQSASANQVSVKDNQS